MIVKNPSRVCVQYIGENLKASSLRSLLIRFLPAPRLAHAIIATSLLASLNFHSTESWCGLTVIGRPTARVEAPQVRRRWRDARAGKASVANSPGTIDLTFPAMTSLPFDRNGSNVTKNGPTRNSWL